MAYGLLSTCKESCDPGFSRNGDPDLVCIKCDDSCATCLDDGNVGDADICVTCAVDYDFFDPNTRKCLKACPPTHFATEDNQCLPCADDCLTCSGSADFCTACKPESSLPFLYENQCLVECPEFHGSSNGICHKCEFPCLTCSSGP